MYTIIYIIYYIYESELIRCLDAGNQPPPQSFKSMRMVKFTDVVLLGSPIGDASSINVVLQGKIESLKTVGERLNHLARHDALLLIVRTAPCMFSVTFASPV